MHGEAQQSMVHLKGDGIAPGLQVLLPKEDGQAGEDLKEKRRKSLSSTSHRERVQGLTNSGKAQRDLFKGLWSTTFTNAKEGSML